MTPTNLIQELKSLCAQQQVAIGFEFYPDNINKLYFVISSFKGGLKTEFEISYYIILDKIQNSISLETETLCKPIYDGDINCIDSFMSILRKYKDIIFHYVFRNDINENKKAEDK